MAPWIFIHGTDVINKGLIVLFFGLFCYFSIFFPLLPPLEIFLSTPLSLDLQHYKEPFTVLVFSLRIALFLPNILKVANHATNLLKSLQKSLNCLCEKNWKSTLNNRFRSCRCWSQI